MAFFASKVEKMRQEYETQGLFLCGDLNVMPYSNSIRYAYKLPRIVIPVSQLKAFELQRPELVKEI